MPSIVTASDSTSVQSRSCGQSGAPSMKTIGRTARHPADHRPRAHDPAHVREKSTRFACAEVRLIRGLARDREEEAALDVQRALRLAGRTGGVREQVRRLALDLDRIELAGCLRRARPTTGRGPTPSGSESARRQTTTCSTLGASASASSRTPSSGTSRPRGTTRRPSARRVPRRRRDATTPPGREARRRSEPGSRRRARTRATRSRPPAPSAENVARRRPRRPEVDERLGEASHLVRRAPPRSASGAAPSSVPTPRPRDQCVSRAQRCTHASRR
jgi:hypothetical protein